MRNAIFWVITQRRFGTTYRHHFQGSAPLMMRPIGCPEMSARNYNYSLRNCSEGRWKGLVRECIPQMFSGWVVSNSSLIASIRACASVAALARILSWFVDRRLRLKRDGTRAETRFRLSSKRTSPFKSAGPSVQSTTGSRGVHISGSNVGYTMFWGSVKSTDYPLHSLVSPSLPHHCVTVCHHISAGLCFVEWLLL